LRRREGRRDDRGGGKHVRELSNRFPSHQNIPEAAALAAREQNSTRAE
jgi:hypothetical protein